MKLRMAAGEYTVMQAEADAKSSLLSDIGSYSRLQMNEYVLALEKINPTFEPATAALLNGVWEIVATGFGSPGIIGFQAIKAIPGSVVDITDLSLTISSVNPRVTAATTIKIASAKIDVEVKLELEALSGTRLRETYKDMKISSLDLPLSSLPMQVASREMIVSYLDEDLLIVRDPFGSPEILRRKNMEFLSSSEPYNADMDDITAPSS
eukprot:CAMPEP_0119034586 /NCGR_PEP_ID=MMETSP1177-20130426/1576_1 /TAXON_ID=2985 /ORGANISM="Ochromonas sp, Strain CCMP1899" /LENGTH=208 /DNA_ID=CAMNT_0006992111 /DNA_START=149 /DNA_END=775 /DNA_ORIENTATION=+